MTAPWFPAKCLAFDLETTGTDVDTDRIVTACAAIVEHGEVVYRREWLLAVEVDIPAEASAVHGVSTEHAREHGIPAAQGVKEIAGAIRFALQAGIVVAPFNATFDLSMLNAECVRAGLGTLTEFCGGDIWPVLDPFVIEKETDKYRPGSRKLGDVAKQYGVGLTDAHNATADAVAAVAVLGKLAERSQLSTAELCDLYADRKYPKSVARSWQELGRMSLAELHDAQRRWYAEQATSLSMHWQGKVADLRDQALRDDPPGDESLSADERRELLYQECDKYERRVAGICAEWPLRTLKPAEEAKAA